MADKKISQLASASTPLAGTEVLPIVQSSATVKVATDDLTVKNIRSNATTGILQMAGVGAAATRTMTVPDANFTVARIDAANTFTGNQTLGTGNLIMGTADKGIDFSANANAPGMTSELLNDYEEGTWTPTVVVNSGTATGYTIANSVYTKVGRLVTLKTQITPTGGTFGNGTGYCQVSGLPFVPSGTFAGQMSNSANLIKGEFALASTNAALVTIFIMEGITITVGNSATLQVIYFV